MYRSLVKNCPEFIRTSMLTFFHNIADDLEHTIQNLHDVCTIIMQKLLIKCRLLIKIYFYGFTIFRVVIAIYEELI